MGIPIKCKIRFHGRYKEIISQEYDSITEAKKTLRYWNGPATIVRQNNDGSYNLPKM